MRNTSQHLLALQKVVAHLQKLLVNDAARFCISIEFIDKKLKIDDPVGAISVHGVCGALGTILVGVFAIDGGLLYGGGFDKLGIQIIGVAAIGAWALGTSFIVLYILKKTKLGLYIYSIGGNEEATKLSGVNVDRYKIIVYTILN